MHLTWDKEHMLDGSLLANLCGRPWPVLCNSINEEQEQNLMYNSFLNAMVYVVRSLYMLQGGGVNLLLKHSKYSYIIIVI